MRHVMTVAVISSDVVTFTSSAYVRSAMEAIEVG